MAILGIVGLLTFLMAYFANKKKWYWVIKRYNATTEEEKQKVNWDKLLLLTTNTLYMTAVCLWAMTIGIWMNSELIVVVSVLSIVLASIAIILKAQKEFKEIDKNKNVFVKISPYLAVLVMIFVAIFLTFTLVVKTEITVDKKTIDISGIYGKEIAVEDISELKLEDTLREMSWKINGSAIGSKYEGHFKGEDGKNYVLYVDEEIGKFVSFKYKDKRYIMNTSTKKETEKLYKAIQKEIAK